MFEPEELKNMLYREGKSWMKIGMYERRFTVLKTELVKDAVSLECADLCIRAAMEAKQLSYSPSMQNFSRLLERLANTPCSTCGLEKTHLL